MTTDPADEEAKQLLGMSKANGAESKRTLWSADESGFESSRQTKKRFFGKSKKKKGSKKVTTAVESSGGSHHRSSNVHRISAL